MTAAVQNEFNWLSSEIDNDAIVLTLLHSVKETWVPLYLRRQFHVCKIFFIT
jgi:hypothetical protein